MVRLVLVSGRLLCLIFVLNTHSGNTQSFGTEFGSQLGQKIMDGFVYFEGVSVSAMACAAVCSRNESCLSAAFNQGDMSCALSAYRVNGLDNQHRLTPQTAWTAVSKKGCKEGWVEIGDACYYVYPNPKTFSQAIYAGRKVDCGNRIPYVGDVAWTQFQSLKKQGVTCQDEGGKLAEPRSLAAFELLRNYMDTNLDAYSYWIGMSDIDVEGQFVWISDETAVTYDAWFDGQPNHGTAAIPDDCVACSTGGYKWADRPCNEVYEPICEI